MNNKTEPIKFNHRIRLVVSDLDGTLLNEEKRISPRSLAAIRKLRRCGVLFTVCTGREYAILEHYAKQIQPSAPMICNNGGEVVSFPQSKVIFRRLLPKPEILFLVEYCLSQGADFCITTPEGAYFPNGSAMTGFYSDYHKQSRQEGLHLFPIHYISTGQELESLPLNKMIFRSNLTSAENIINISGGSFPLLIQQCPAKISWRSFRAASIRRKDWFSCAVIWEFPFRNAVQSVTTKMT